MSVKIFKILFIIAHPQGDADVRQKLADVRAAAFEITTVGTLAQALVLLQSSSFDVLLVNLAVPDYRGIDSLRHLILAAKEAPVIVVSSSYDEVQALEAVRAGAEDYTVGSRMNSAAFERVILYSVERHLAHQKTALQFSVSRVLAESTDLHDAADGILGALCEFAKFERGEIWQSDASPSRAVLLTSWPRPSHKSHPPDCLSLCQPAKISLARSYDHARRPTSRIRMLPSPFLLAWGPEHSASRRSLVPEPRVPTKTLPSC
jgi:DNA-binding NarL/FixJ family response regulator